MKIDRNSKTPLHTQAEQMLRQLIESDEYRHGKFLPNEIELSQQLHISRNTLRQAINKLVFEGWLVRKRGVGTKVVQRSFVSGVKNWLSFSQEMRMMGIAVCNFGTNVSRQQPIPVARAFFKLLPEDTIKCVVLERIRGRQEYPFVYFISFFSPRIGLTGDENFSRPLYEILETDYGVVVKTSKERITARLAGTIIAEKLRISPSDPVLVRERFVYDTEGLPVEYNIGYYRADSFTYTIEAER